MGLFIQTFHPYKSTHSKMALESHADDNDGTTSTTTARLPESNSNDQSQLSRSLLPDYTHTHTHTHTHYPVPKTSESYLILPSPLPCAPTCFPSLSHSSFINFVLTFLYFNPGCLNSISGPLAAFPDNPNSLLSGTGCRL